MRLRTSILVFSAMLMASACSTSRLEESEPDQVGYVSVELAPEIVVSRDTKAAVYGPDVNDFTIEFFKYTDSGLLRLYRDTYANTVGQKIPFNAADYKVHARHGDSLGVGFNAAYYAVEQTFPVRPQTEETINLEAKFANVKVAVEYGDNLKFDWEEFYAKVKCTTKGGRKRHLQFSQTETRAGYLPAGAFVVELYIKVNGEWMYYHSPELDAQPADFITFNIETEKAQSQVNIIARIDDGLDVLEKSIDVSSSWLPQDTPSIRMLDINGRNFGNQTFNVVEAGNVVRSDLKADIIAPGVIDHCYLDIKSEYLQRLGVPGIVDLATDLDPSVEAALKSIGLKWMKGMKGQRLGYVDFSGITKWLNDIVCDSNNLFKAEFRINVIDQRQAVGESMSAPVSFLQLKPEFELYDIPSYNCWATRIEKITAWLIVGNPDALKVEYRKYTDGEDAWREVTPGANTDVYTITGLSPSTLYEVRARYNNNSKTEIRVYPRTEAALQVGNNSFEQHTYESFKTTKWLVINYGSEYITWYQPYKSGESDRWWAVNSSATLDASITPEYVTYKCFPTVSFTSGAHSGSRAVIVASVAIDDWGSEAKSGNAKTGKLFIGTADNSSELKGNQTSVGHAFDSRPSSMSFWYKLSSHNSDPFSAEIQIMDSGGVKIASGSINNISTSTSSWTQVTVPLTYTTQTKKAGKIYIIFNSSATNSTDSRKTSFTRLNSSGSEVGSGNIHAGNIVWIDDVVLNYE